MGYESKKIIANVSFTVDSGDYLCIIGANGTGKSTLAKVIAGLCKPLGGNIFTGDGVGIHDIGYLPQQTDIQRDFPASVGEIVLSGCLGRCNKPFYGKNEKILAQHNMKRLGISNIASKCYRNLSGGQQQRVLLARALCSAGKILLLDEPVSGLDPDASRSMYDILENINNDGMTVIMITHDMNAVYKYASHILQLGETSFFGTKEQALECGILLREDCVE